MLRMGLVSVLMLLSGWLPVYADNHQQDRYMPQFRFNFDAAAANAFLDLNAAPGEAFFHPDFFSSLSSDTTGNGTHLRQYDAMLFYPIDASGMKMDVGVNIKYLDGVKTRLEDGLRKSHNFREAIPMIYATALFDLPFSGLSAGFEGSHYDLADTLAFDYKAKVAYEWNQGFGLQGGWQHQQYSLDGTDNSATDYESKGVFLDLFMRF